MTRYVEKDCASIIVKSKLPDTTYVVNPYTGCEFGCSYCYASFMGRFVGETIESWGEYVFVKRNAVEVFKRDLRKLSDETRQGSMLLSSVTDAWQPVERKYRLSSGIVAELVRARYPGVVSVLTKSPIVLDDLELLRQLPRADIGVTVTTTDDNIARVLEVRSPSARRRIHTLERLNAGGISTYAFVGPLLPHFSEQKSALHDLFKSLRDAGTREIYVELINKSRYIRERLDSAYLSGDRALIQSYIDADELKQRSRLARLVNELVEQYDFRLRLGKVLDHRQDPK
ncbi:radical SAM protein [Hydrogenophaga sp.]